MAKIKTDRPEAAQWNGREAKFVHDVTAADGPAYNARVDQTIVEIDGAQIYFFANEVILTDDEAKAADKRKQEAQEKASEDKTKAREARNRNLESFAQFKRGAEKKDEGKPSTEDPKAAQPGGPVTAGQDFTTQHGGREVFNRLASDAPERPQTDSPPLRQDPSPKPTVTKPGHHPEEPAYPSGAQAVPDEQPDPKQQPRAPNQRK